MSILSDRANLASILKEALEPLGIEVSPYAPQRIRGNLAWLEPGGAVTDGGSFVEMKLTWQLTLTASAKASIKEQQKQLDELATASITAIVEKQAANLESVGEYFSMIDAANQNAAYPAVQLTLTSYTGIKE